MILEGNKIRVLPVVERSKVVGVITEKDIVRAESKAMSMKRQSDSSSYTVYQTRSPEAGVGRLLVAVADSYPGRQLASACRQAGQT